MAKSVLITSGEHSGELYGSLLAKELFSRWDDLRIFGIGGRLMREAGVEVFAGYSSAIGLIEALAVYKEVKKTYERTVEIMEFEKPDVVVLIDYPDFNFRVGKKARELGAKVLYYVSPQIWAWRSGRIHTMKEFIDQAAVLLPFEEKIYKDAGIPCEFVGHPILEGMSSFTDDKTLAREELGLDTEGSLVALLPGSRPSELNRLLPVLLDAVRLMKKDHPELKYVLSLAPNLERTDYEQLLAPFEQDGIPVSRESAVLMYTAADAAVVASGTAALQGVFRETPLVVLYKVNPITYRLMKMLVKVKFANLANIILGREAVPELLQGAATASNVVMELKSMLFDNDRINDMQKDLHSVREMFADKHPTRRLADMVDSLAGWAR